MCIQDTSILEHAYLRALWEIHSVILNKPSGLFINITSCISHKALVGMLQAIHIHLPPTVQDNATSSEWLQSLVSES